MHKSLASYISGYGVPVVSRMGLRLPVYKLKDLVHEYDHNKMRSHRYVLINLGIPIKLYTSKETDMMLYYSPSVDINYDHIKNGYYNSLTKPYPLPYEHYSYSEYKEVIYDSKLYELVGSYMQSLVKSNELCKIGVYTHYFESYPMIL